VIIAIAVDASPEANGDVPYPIVIIGSVEAAADFAPLASDTAYAWQVITRQRNGIKTLASTVDRSAPSRSMRDKLVVSDAIDVRVNGNRTPASLVEKLKIGQALS
jgi:hypothetical protein